MKRILLVVAFLTASAWGQVSNPSIVLVTSAPSGSCSSGLPDEQVISTGVIYTCQNDTWGSLATGSSGNAVTVNGASVPANAQVLATNSSSQLVSLSPATDAQMLTLDLNRSDSYTEDGTIERPYKNLSTLVIPSTGLASIFSSPNASYSITGVMAPPAIPLTLYGNNSTWTTSGGLTLTAKTISYDLIDGGPVTYNYASTDRSEKHGGAYLGSVNLAQGYLHAFGSNLSGNSNTFTVGGASTAALLYGEAITGSQKIASGGAGALIALYSPNMTKSSGYNVDMTNGGQLLFSGGILNTAAGTANIYLPTANSPSTFHAISGLIVGTGTGVNCVNGTTTYVAYGFNLAPVSNCTFIPGYQGPTNFLGNITTPTVLSGASQGGSVPSVNKFVVPYTLFTAAATTQTVTISTLPARSKITGITADHSVAFAGPSVTALGCTVGGTSGVSAFLGSINVFATAGTGWLDGGGWTSGNTQASQPLTVTCTATGNNLGNGSVTSLTSGSMEIWVSVVVLQ
jgi:hypothetical protein